MSEAVDFCNKLIQRKPSKRLGFNGPDQLRKHAWFRDFPWGKLMAKALPAPYKPAASDNYNPRQVLNKWNDELQIAAVRQTDIDSLFKGYFYDKRVQRGESDGKT